VAGGAGALEAVLIAPALIMRVNSPGPELTGGAATGVGAGVDAAAGAADSLWIKRVTLPASPPVGSEDRGAGGAGVKDGSGS
jgi:hypothetical protein